MSNALTTSSPIVSQQNNREHTAFLSTPSDRDLEIYKKVKIQLVPQYEVAVDNNLHYSRVSQIVKDVHHWLIAGGQPTDPQLRDHAARQRLSRAAHQLRLTRCLELATDYMESRPVQRESTKRRLVHGQEQWCEETKRDPLPETRLAAIRLVVRTSEALHKLEQTEREGEAPAEPKLAADQDLLNAIFDVLCTWRTCAAAEGRINNAPDGRPENASDVTSLVATTLNNLLGTQLCSPGNPIGSSPPADDSSDRRPCAGGALTGQLQDTDAQPDPPGSGVDCAQSCPSPYSPTPIDSRPVSLGEPETSGDAASAPLNFSAEPSDLDSINAVEASTCADSNTDVAAEKPKLEPRATPQHPAPPPDFTPLPNSGSSPFQSSASLYSTAQSPTLLVPDH